jgi:hypothetical protein
MVGTYNLITTGIQTGNALPFMVRFPSWSSLQVFQLNLYVRSSSLPFYLSHFSHLPLIMLILFSEIKHVKRLQDELVSCFFLLPYPNIKTFSSLPYFRTLCIENCVLPFKQDWKFDILTQQQQQQKEQLHLFYEFSLWLCILRRILDG